MEKFAAPNYQLLEVYLNDIKLPIRTWQAKTSSARRRGLLGRDSLPSDEALLLKGASVIHMLGMRFPIDAVFISPSGKIVKVKKRLQPGRRLSGSLFAWTCLELAAGTCEKLDLQAKKYLNFYVVR